MSILQMPWDQPPIPVSLPLSSRDFKTASDAVDDGTLRIIQESGVYLGACHMQDDLQAFGAGDDEELVSYALFQVVMDGVEASAPLSYGQLSRLMELSSTMRDNRPGFRDVLAVALCEIDTHTYDQVYLAGCER